MNLCIYFVVVVVWGGGGRGEGFGDIEQIFEQIALRPSESVVGSSTSIVLLLPGAVVVPATSVPLLSPEEVVVWAITVPLSMGEKEEEKVVPEGVDPSTSFSVVLRVAGDAVVDVFSEVTVALVDVVVVVLVVGHTDGVGVIVVVLNPLH